MADEDRTVKRIVALSSKLTALQAEVVAVSAERAQLVRGLQSRGWSLAQIATATGLSRSRVQQLAGSVA